MVSRSNIIYNNIIYLLTAIGLLPGGSGYFSCTQKQGVGLRTLAWWDCGFETHRGNGFLSVMSVVCCQTEVSATG